MSRTLTTLMLLAVAALGASPARAQGDRNLRNWFAGGELGAGALSVSSDQIGGDRNPTLAMGFLAGHRIGSRVRLAGEVNGWLIQAYDLSNPAVGESVTNVWGLVDVFPIRRLPLFVRAGGGLALYQNNRPEGSNGRGGSWTAGAGYEIRATDRLGLAPMVEYAYGRFDDVNNPITVETGRHYSVVEFKIEAIWHWGKQAE